MDRKFIWNKRWKPYRKKKGENATADLITIVVTFALFFFQFVDPYIRYRWRFGQFAILQLE